MDHFLTSHLLFLPRDAIVWVLCCLLCFILSMMKRGSTFIILLALAGPLHHDDIISLMIFEPTKVQIWNNLLLYY